MHPLSIPLGRESGEEEAIRGLGVGVYHPNGMARTMLARLSRLSESEVLVLPVEGNAPPRRSVLLIREGTEVRAYWNVCKHLPIPLDAGLGELPPSPDGRLRCLTHGALFEPMNGLCVAGPCEGQSLDAIELEFEGDFVYADI